MTQHIVSQQMGALLARIGSFLAFEAAWEERVQQPGVVDLVFGNPHEMPVEGFWRALQRWSEPQTPDWFAYTFSKPDAQVAVAASLRESTALTFMPEDIVMSTGAFAGLSMCLRAVVDPGDEVIFLSPPWFFYETLIRAEGGTPVRVRLEPPAFDLDMVAIEAAITPRTRAIIVNTPHNPTGRIYPRAMLEDLAAVLAAASQRAGRPIYVLADEAYRRIVFDGRQPVSPAVAYPHTLLIYTYGKTLLTPGQRLGYVALPPTLPEEERQALRQALLVSQVTLGYAVPNAVLQYAVPELEGLSIDIAAVQRRRDWLVAELRALGYEVHVPEATFYLLPRSPWVDDVAFIEMLARHGLLALPGALAEIPGYFRLSLTGTDAMIERALPALAAALQEARSTRPPEESLAVADD